MGAEAQAGEQSPIPAGYLQPELGDADQRVLPISHDLLAAFEAGEECTDDEREQARRANASLARRMADVELYRRLAARQFSGADYEVFRAELAAYAFPVLRSWIRRGLIFQYCAERGRPLDARPAERDYLSESNDDRQGLAMETAAEALNLFHTRALVAGTWTGEGGATLKTYFVGACLQTFPNVFRRWQRTEGKYVGRTAAYGLDPGLDDIPGRRPLHPVIGADPAEIIACQDAVFSKLAAMNPTTRQVAARIVLADETLAEAGKASGISERAVEGRLYRYRTGAARRREERDTP